MAMSWTTHACLPLRGLTAELSAPVLVKRSRRFCWFPSLIRQNEDALWAIMTAYADIHTTGAFCYLTRSRDGGLTWDEARVIGDAGLNHLILPDGRALVLPYKLRPRPNGALGAPCNLISPNGELSSRASGVNVTGWPRPMGAASPDLGTAPFVFNGQVVRGQSGEFLTTLYGKFEGDARYSLLLAESPDGLAWRIRSLIAGPDCPLEGKEGPCESALCRLANGRLMCVFRLGQFVRYGRADSNDDGRTWSTPTNIAPGSVEPSLQVMGDGVVALSGGRSGLFAWLSAGGQGEDWQALDIVAHHNACQPRDPIDARYSWMDRDEMLRQGLHGFSSCYTELVRLDDHHLLLIYDRLGLGWHQIPDELDETNSVWVIRIKVAKKEQRQVADETLPRQHQCFPGTPL